jgi:putative transcriptional regulator
MEIDKATFAKKIGKRIIFLRKQKGWSQSELARQCEKDRQAIERIENGKTVPNTFTLYEIAKALNVNVCQLLNIHS